jgi:hypothetical protein
MRVRHPTPTHPFGTFKHRGVPTPLEFQSKFFVAFASGKLAKAAVAVAHLNSECRRYSSRFRANNMIYCTSIINLKYYTVTCTVHVWIHDYYKDRSCEGEKLIKEG